MIKYLLLVSLFFCIGYVHSQDVVAPSQPFHYTNFTRTDLYRHSLNMRQRSLMTTQSDTSAVMKKLNGVNDFMQWYMVYFPVPFGSFSKETSWLFGLSKYNAFTIGRHKKDTVTQPSSISGFGYYTMNTKYKLVLESNLMLKNNKAIWKTDFIYLYYPLLYYGVGNNTDLKQQ